MSNKTCVRSDARGSGSFSLIIASIHTTNEVKHFEELVAKLLQFRLRVFFYTLTFGTGVLHCTMMHGLTNLKF